MNLDTCTTQKLDLQATFDTTTANLSVCTLNLTTCMEDNTALQNHLDLAEAERDLFEEDFDELQADFDKIADRYANKKCCYLDENSEWEYTAYRIYSDGDNVKCLSDDSDYDDAIDLDC